MNFYREVGMSEKIIQTEGDLLRVEFRGDPIAVQLSIRNWESNRKDNKSIKAVATFDYRRGGGEVWVRIFESQSEKGSNDQT